MIDNIFYKNGFFPRMFLEYFFVIIISVAIAVLLLLRRKIFCIIGGYSYLIFGSLGWLIKIIYICYLVFGNKVKNYYEPNYSAYYFNFIIFLIHIALIFVRLYCCYLIKIMYKSLGFFERYSREKEHAEFIEKLGNKMGDNKNNDPNSNTKTPSVTISSEKYEILKTTGECDRVKIVRTRRGMIWRRYDRLEYEDKYGDQYHVS